MQEAKFLVCSNIGLRKKTQLGHASHWSARVGELCEVSLAMLHGFLATAMAWFLSIESTSCDGTIVTFQALTGILWH